MKHKLYLAATLALLLVSHANAQLTGNMRQQFLEGSVKTCYKTQRAGTINQGISDNVLMKYCKCSMTYLADMLNNYLLLDIDNGNLKLNPYWLQLAHAYCSKNYNKKN